MFTVFKWKWQLNEITFDLVDGEQGFDHTEFKSAVFQRPFQYLKLFSENSLDMKFRFREAEGTPKECLDILLRYETVHNMYSISRSNLNGLMACHEQLWDFNQICAH